LTLYGTQASLTISDDGRLGVGVTNPIEELEVAGNAVISGSISAGNMGVFRNRIINGDMRVAQRGTSFATLQAGQYTVDRFRTPSNAVNGQTSLVAETTGGPSGLPNFISILTNFTSNNGALIEQAIENINLSDCVSGTTMTLSFWAKTTFNPTSIALTTGVFVPSAANNFQTLTLSYGTGNNSIPITSSWQRYVVSFYVTDNLMSTNGCLMQIWANAQCGVAFTGVQVEKGTIATPFEFRPFAVELQLCQRYFCTSYEHGTAPGTANTTEGRIGTYSPDTNAMMTIYYPVTMRAPAALTIYGGNTGAVGKFNLGGFLDNYDAVYAGASSKSAIVLANGTGVAGRNWYYFHFAANAEL
jgi:hypothetical protein